MYDFYRSIFSGLVHILYVTAYWRKAKQENSDTTTSDECPRTYIAFDLSSCRIHMQLQSAQI